MEIEKAKELVIKAGKLLVDKGLIQRTWGNVSCRVSETQFVITPSGMDYMSLTPDKIVAVNIEDCSYEGEIKPSSEKGVHAECYKLRPEVNFVIHTHQTYASLAGLSGMDINTVTGEEAELIGSAIPLAAYGLPGTGKLKKGVSDAVRRSDSKAILMYHHGAVCVGADLEEAFAVANALEVVCKKVILERFNKVSGKAADHFTSVSEYIAANLMRSTDIRRYEPYSSEREFAVAVMTPAKGGEPISVNISTGLPVDPNAFCPETAMLHAQIYKKRSDVNAIVHSTAEDTVHISKLQKTIRPFLDDFAQIAGFTVKNACYDPDNALKSAQKVVKKLKNRDAVLLSHNGAVCVGSDMDEAKAVELVTEKGCQSVAAAELFGTTKECINLAESVLMRVIYKTKYSKKKAK